MTGPGPDRVRIFPDPEALFTGAAGLLAEVLEEGGRFPRLVLAGGRTPVELYRRLASPPHRDRGFWPRLRVTFTDERPVPPDHEASNYGMARKNLLVATRVPRERVLRFRGEDPPAAAAVKMHRRLLDWNQRAPLFDVVLLGLGEDGHVASLFPSETRPDFGVHLAAATRHPDGGARLSLTPRALRSTRRTFVLVSGASKSEAVRTALGALEAGETSPRIPASMVVPDSPAAVWLLDAEAGSALSGEGA